MKKLATLVGASLATVLVPFAAAEAHHSFTMFDDMREEVVQGTVTRWAFNSPHVFLYITDESGALWGFEGAAPPALITRNPGMTGTTFTVGQHVTVVHCPLRDGRNGGGVGIVITDDGTLYNPSDAGCPANQRASRWPGWIEAGFTSKAEAEAAEAAAAPPAAPPAP